VVAFGMVRSAVLVQLPYLGKSLGESGSDGFQITVPLRSNWLIFWCVGMSGQYAMKRFIVMVEPLLLVISMPS
jgi:hypothetical protein